MGEIVSADPFGSNPRYRQRELVSFTKTVVIEDRAHHIQKLKHNRENYLCGIILQDLNFDGEYICETISTISAIQEIEFGIAEKASE